MAGNQIQFGIGFNVNEVGLNKLKQSLKEIQQMSAKDLMGTGNFKNLQQAEQELIKIKKSASDVQIALNKAFNANLGTTNLSRFNAELQKLNISAIAQQFNNAGAVGQQTFNNLATSVMTSNVKLKQTYSLIENMKTTLTNTIKWNIASGAINSFTGSISNAFNYVKALDSSLTDIRVVTGESREEMSKFAIEANNAAQALGRQTKEYTNAALSFYQQGLDDEEVRVRTEATLKAQNITGAGKELADELTAVWNGFQVGIEESELAVDKLAAVADSSASNMSELATGMSKTASVANSMGVSLDQLTAQLATIIATTRQAPESVGNALKTIYTRINDIKTGSDEAEVSLGNYSSQMAKVGFSVLDANGNLRDTGEVIEEIGSRWQNLSREQQIYLARTMAGQRQMNNLIALFDNWTKYSEMLNVSLNAEGALNEKNARYMESLSAHINQFKAATEGLQDTLIDEEAIKTVTDLGTNIINLFNNIIKGTGGVKTATLALSGVLLQTFSSNIATGISNFIQNLQNAKDNVAQLASQLQIIREFQNVQNNGLITQLSHWSEQVVKFQQNGTFTGEQASQINALMQEYNQLQNTKIAYEEKQAAAEQYYKLITKESINFAQLNGQEAVVVENNLNKFEKKLQHEEQLLEKRLDLIERTVAAERAYASNISNKNFDALNKNQTKLRTALQEQLTDLRQLAQTSGANLGLNLDSQKLREVFQLIHNLSADLKSDNAPQVYAEKYFTAYQEIIASAQKAAGQTKEAFKQGMDGAVADTEAKMAQIQSTIENALKAASLRQRIQGIVNALGGIAGTLGGLRAVTNSFKVLHDETLSVNERVLQFAQSFAMGMSMIVFNLQKLGVSITSIRAALLTLTNAETVANAQHKLKVAMLEAETIEQKQAAKAAYEHAIAEQFEATGIKAVVAALWAEVKALYARAQAWLIAHPAIVAVGAALAIVGASIAYVVTSLNAEAKAFEKAQNRAKEAQNRYKDIKTAYDDLKSSLEDYQNAQDAIEQLTIGTGEWRDAIADANEQVLQLLETYPQLAKYLKNENGRLTFDTEGLEDYQQEQQAQVVSAQNASLQSQNTVRDQEIRAMAAEIAQTVFDQWGNPVLGPEPAMIVAEARKQLIDQGIEPTLNKVLELTTKQGLDDQILVQQLLNRSGDLDRLTELIRENNTINENTKEAIAHNINESQNNEQYNESIYKDAIDRMTQAAIEEFKVETTAERKQQTRSINANDYAKLRGYEVEKVGYNKTTFLDQSGKEIEVSNDVIVSELGLADAAEKAAQSLTSYVDQMDSITESMSTDNAKHALASFVGGGEKADISALTGAELNEVSTMVVKEFEAFGFATEEAAIDLLNTLRGFRQEEINKIGKDLKGSSKNVYKDLTRDDRDLTLDNIRNISSILGKAYSTAGNEGVEALGTLFKNAGKQVGPLSDALAGITKDSSVADLSSALKDADINLETFGLSVQELAQILGLTGRETFESISSKYKEASDIIDGIQFGDGISAEDAEKLTALGLNLQDFFMMGANGEQILITKAKELQEAAAQIQMDKLYHTMLSAKEEANNLAEILQNVFTEENLVGSAYSKENATVDWNKAENQLTALQSMANIGQYDQGQIDDYKNALADKTITEDSIKALDEIAQAAENAYNQEELLVEKNHQLAQEFLNSKQALDSFRLRLDEDIDEEEWQDLTDHIAKSAEALEVLDDRLKDDKVAAAEVAQAILRFDDAIQDVTDNYEDWAKALETGTLQEQSKAVEGLRDAYADLLDLDGSSLSDGFLTSAKNLELLKEAAEGSEEAYDELMQNVQQDIATQVHLDISDFQANFDALMAQYYEGQNLDDLAIGASLDNTDFLAGLSEMVTAAGMSAQQAMDYLGSMGIDAQVVEHSVPSTETHETGGYTATAQELELPYNIVYGNGTGVGHSTGRSYVSYPVYTPQTETFTTTDEKKAVSLEVTSATKSSGGGFKHSQASHGGGGAGKKKGGGGGGGGKQPKKTEKFKSKIDPYHDVNIKIGDVKEGLDKLGKQRDKLIGKDAVDNLAKQINLMEREKELLQEKAKIAQEELQKQADELAKYGAIIDSEGNILNYKQLLLDKQNQINEAIDIANGLDADSQEAYLKYVEDLKKEYKELEEGIKNLDDTKQLLDDLGLDYQDIINQQIELAMEAFNLEIEVHLDMKDAKKEFNEFRKKVMDQVKDDQYGGLAAAAARNYGLYYNNEGTGIIRELQQHTLDIQREAEIVRNGGFSQIYGDNLAAAAEDLKKYNDELMKGLEEVQELVDEVHDDFLSAIDAMDEAFDTQQENLDKIDDLLQHDMEILQLIHGEENYDEMTLLWQQQVDQDTKRLAALQQEQQYWKNRVAQYQEGTEEWKKAMENWEDAFEKTNEAMLNSVKNLQSQWENSINKIMSSLRNATYGGNMNAALEDWDKMNWHSDRYLDSLERATGLLNLQNKYQDMINKTTDPRIQAKLAELEEKQLDALSQKEHLREIDLKISEQQLAVLQAQMALEDAQQAKTKLRLRRDSQGNYTYQYIADEDDIAEKTQEYANALAEYRQMVKDSLHDDLQDLSDYTQEFYEKMQEAQMMYGDDTERLMEEQARLYELYMGDDGYITRLAADANYSMQDLQEATYIQAKGLNELLRDDLFNKFLGPDAEMRNAINELLGAGGAVPTILDAFVNDSAFVAFDNISEKCKETLSGPEGLLPEWQSALWTIAEQYESDFVPRVIEAMNQLQYANQAYVDGLAIMQQAANRTTQQIALGLYYDTAYTNALNDATNTLLQTQDAELQKAEQVYESLKKNEEAFKDQAQAAIDAANAVFLYWLALNGMTASTVPYTMNGISGVNISSPSIGSSSPSYGDGGGGSGSGGGGDAGSSQPTSSSSKNQNYGAANAGVYRGVSNTSSIQGTSKGMGGTAQNSPAGNPDSSAYWSRLRYATGGYTGEWSNDPRWALLDQKELVLNADDTKNMLSAVSIVRTIADKVASATNAAAANIGTQGLGSLLAAAGEQILQNVVINADFPAVQDAAQIKQAFNELVNLASQRASVGGRNR